MALEDIYGTGAFALLVAVFHCIFYLFISRYIYYSHEPKSKPEPSVPGRMCFFVLMVFGVLDRQRGAGPGNLPVMEKGFRFWLGVIIQRHAVLFYFTYR